MADQQTQEFTSADSVAGITTRTRAGNIVYGHFDMGSNPRNADVTTMVLFPPAMLTVARPRVVILQPRQTDNQDFGFPDQFAVQVIDTGRTAANAFIRFRTRRIDAGSDRPTGWGQQLRIDFLIIDDGTEFG
jgi:hypothetical protein